MISTETLERCSEKFYSLRSFLCRITRVNMDMPVRTVEIVSSVYPQGGGNQPPDGAIYAANYSDGTRREIFIWGTPIDRDFESAVFLREGRKGNRINEVLSLEIASSVEPVPESLVTKIREYTAARDQASYPLAAARPG